MNSEPIHESTKAPAPESSGLSSSPKPVRWRLGIGLLVAGMFTIVWMQFFTQVSQQDRNLRSMIGGIVTALLLLIWCLAFSRLRWKIRLLSIGAFLAVVGLGAALFEIKGVTGDLLPILKPRWQQRESATISAPVVSPVAAPATNTATLPPPPEGIEDYPQFLGPNRNAVVKPINLARDWQAQPPEQLWRQPIGPAWTGFVTAGNRAVSQEQRGENELVVCYELTTGKVLWAHSYAAHYFTTLGGDGPRSNPSITSNRVYALGATGILNCLELASGVVVWTRNILEENDARVPSWGLSCSPLVLGDRVIVNAGGRNNRSLVAYHKDTGEFLWGGGIDGAGYSSPVLAKLAGVAQILSFTSNAASGCDPQDGTVLWTHGWKGDHPHVAVPVVIAEDRVLFSSGYGHGSELLQIKAGSDGKMSALRLWKSLKLKAKFTNFVLHEGSIYGLDDGILACLDPATGEQKWKDGRYGHGQNILTGNLLLLMAEDGNVVLIEPNPNELKEMTRFRALNSKTWNPPALAGRFLLVRNDREAACFRLPLAAMKN